MTVLKRRRAGRRANTKHFKHASKPQEDFDARDEISKFDDVNNAAKKTPAPDETPEEAENVEFYQIYSKLVTKIRNRLDKPEFPSIDCKRESKPEEAQK